MQSDDDGIDAGARPEVDASRLGFAASDEDSDEDEDDEDEEGEEDMSEESYGSMGDLDDGNQDLSSNRDN